MMNTDLIGRDFKWKVIRARRPIAESFVKRDYLEAVELAMKQLPDDEFLTEVVIEMDCFRKDGNNHLETFIYWRQNGKHNDYKMVVEFSLIASPMVDE